jgi:hypothetical protein
MTKENKIDKTPILSRLTKRQVMKGRKKIKKKYTKIHWEVKGHSFKKKKRKTTDYLEFFVVVATFLVVAA